MMLAQIDTAKSVLDAYGPYGFGIASVLILLAAFGVFYTRVLKPTQEAAVKVATEQTKQTDNLRLTAAHTEASLALAKAVGTQSEETAKHLRDVLLSKAGH